MSMSLDGFITAANVRPEEPMGDGGLQLHDWAMGEDAHNREILTKGVSGLGAVICGRRTYDHSIPWWGADGPTGPARVSLFVVSHDVPADIPENGVYHFMKGPETALEHARAAAGDKDISVMGGADIAQQYLRAGSLDEIQIHLIPVLFGSGTRLFDHLGDDHIQLEVAEVIDTPLATHLRYRIVK
jgi:dihydrofolate reductase